MYGIVGKISTTGRCWCCSSPRSALPEAAARQAELLQRWGARTTLAEEVRTPAWVRLQLDMADGTPLGTSDGPIRAETPGGEGFEVRSVEFAVGYPNHGFETRQYRGALSFAADAAGTIAVVNLVSLEDLLAGLVPSEIFPGAPAEALKAQAVTARGEVLAKVGTRHLADPYLLCSEQHCAVYRGRSGETPATNAAVEATRGDGALLHRGPAGGLGLQRGVRRPHRGQRGGLGRRPGPEPARTPRRAWPRPRDCPIPGDAPERFLAFDLPAACRRGRFAQPTQVPLGEALHRAAAERARRVARASARSGTSSRSSAACPAASRLLLVSGTRGATELRGELTIRKQFGMLNSALFVVTEERDAQGNPVAFVFRGRGLGPRRGHVSDRAPSAGRRPDRTTGRSSGIISMAPRSRASTSRKRPGGRTPAAACLPGWNSRPFRGYVRTAHR